MNKTQPSNLKIIIIIIIIILWYNLNRASQEQPVLLGGGAHKRWRSLRWNLESEYAFPKGDAGKWASLVAQLVKNLPAMQKTGV